eukprot:TRINITY_DN4179_c3_g1_i1.p2 TRINITY_DN4179_c3_g1~~TRINITY_DN4179_c3_g1_i1.p2  ORF type:complete len:442 (+),score=204.65 TRINITY_DN4179_c3_g1_i1:80-1405(+)
MRDFDKYSDASSSNDETYLPDAKPGMSQELAPKGGVVKECLVEGEGVGRPMTGCKVSVHYVGTLKSNGEKFDSSRDRDEPFEFQLGMGQVIKGWDLGVASMRKGEKSILTCTADYAYGEEGSGATIPPNSTLCFEVELLSWIETTDISEGNDGTLMKKTLKEGEAWDKAEYESNVMVTYWQEGKEDEKVAEARLVIGNEDIPLFLEKTIQSMKKGEKCRVDVAENGSWFVELHEFDTPPSRFSMKGPAKLQLALAKKDEGNTFYKAMKLSAAKRKYKRALEFLEDEYQYTDEEKQQVKKQKIPCYTNLAAVQLAMKAYADCIETCGKALDIDSCNEKALLRRAKAHNFLDNWPECKQDLSKLLEVSPSNADAKKEMEKLKKKTKAQDAKDKQRFGNMFSKLAAMEDKEAAKAPPAVEPAAPAPPAESAEPAAPSPKEVQEA